MEISLLEAVRVKAIQRAALTLLSGIVLASRTRRARKIHFSESKQAFSTPLAVKTHSLGLMLAMTTRPVIAIRSLEITPAFLTQPDTRILFLVVRRGAPIQPVSRTPFSAAMPV